MRSMISGGKPGPSSMIVERDVAARPSASARVTLSTGEIDGVLDQIAEPVDDARIAPADRLGADPLARLQRDGDAEIAMRRDHLLDQRGQRQPRQMRFALRRQAGQALQDLAAAFALRAQQRHVLVVARIVCRARAPSPWRPARWWRAACRVRARRPPPARRAPKDAARAAAPVRWRRAHWRAAAPPPPRARHRRR